MDGDQVRRLEEEIGRAIARAFPRVPRGVAGQGSPSEYVCHLMAKAAVAVYEAAVEEHRGKRPRTRTRTTKSRLP